MKLRIMAAALAVVGSTLIGTATTATPAHAATGWCTSTKVVKGVTGMGGVGYGKYPATSSGSTNCIMGRGSISPAVRALQRAINLCYVNNLGSGPVKNLLVEDGNYGRATEDAVKAVQRLYRITADGVYGPQTRGKIWVADAYYAQGRCVKSY